MIVQAKGGSFRIDAADVLAVSHYRWRFDPRGYPMTNVGAKRTRRPLRLHVFLLGRAPGDLEWDHTNGDRSDNRRRNLRAVTHRENLLASAETIVGKQALRTTCIRGHSFDRIRDARTPFGKPSRVCSTCARERKARP